MWTPLYKFLTVGLYPNDSQVCRNRNPIYLGKQTVSSTPEVIDLSRLVTGYCPDLCSSPSLRETFLDALFVGSGWPTDGSWSLPLSKAQETNILLLLRTIANVFQEGAPIHEGVWITKVRCDTILSAP